jgi:hypothetical protein
VVRGTRIAIGNSHITHGDSVEERTTGILYVVENRALTERPTQLERPLLPLNATTEDLERGPFRLDNLKWLEILSEGVVAHDVCAVLYRLYRLPWLSLRIQLIASAHRESLQLHKFQGMRIEDRGKRNG